MSTQLQDVAPSGTASTPKPDLISVEEAKQLPLDTVREYFATHMNAGQLHFMKLLGFDRVHIASAEGMYYTEHSGRKILDLFGAELTAIAADSFVNQPLEALVPVAAAPVEETRARAARDGDDFIESVVDAVEAHGLKARARRAVFFLEEGTMQFGGLFVTEFKLSCSHTTR